MGLFDHRRTWHFIVKAPPSECVDAFRSAFNGSRPRGPVLTKAKWRIESAPTGAIAVYQGRAGLVAAATIFSSRANDEQQAAIGSQITFETAAGDGPSTECTMWLSSSAKTLGFVADGRFFRPYMRLVQQCLAEIDPELTVSQS